MKQNITCYSNVLGNRKNLSLFPFIYFHGKAQALFNYDLVYVKEKPKDFVRGIYQIRVLSKGKLHKAVAYMWEASNIQRGLIVLKSDKAGTRYAKLCFATKKERL